jgi:hypothetical protein
LTHQRPTCVTPLARGNGPADGGSSNRRRRADAFIILLRHGVSLVIDRLLRGSSLLGLDPPDQIPKSMRGEGRY